MSFLRRLSSCSLKTRKAVYVWSKEEIKREREKKNAEGTDGRIRN
jgi:hypothetical protein